MSRSAATAASRPPPAGGGCRPAPLRPPSTGRRRRERPGRPCGGHPPEPLGQVSHGQQEVLERGPGEHQDAGGHSQHQDHEGHCASGQPVQGEGDQGAYRASPFPDRLDSAGQGVSAGHEMKEPQGGDEEHQHPGEEPPLAQGGFAQDQHQPHSQQGQRAEGRPLAEQEGEDVPDRLPQPSPGAHQEHGGEEGEHSNTPPQTSDDMSPMRDLAADHRRNRHDRRALEGVAGRLGADFPLAGLLDFLGDSRLRPLALRRVGVRVLTCQEGILYEDRCAAGGFGESSGRVGRRPQPSAPPKGNDPCGSGRR